MHWEHEPIRFGPRAVPARSGRAKTRAWVIFQECSAGHLLRPGTGRGPLVRPGQLTGNGWFMESPLSFFRMHWDHKPIPNPSQEGNRRDADECLLPSWEGSGVGRFMESEQEPGGFGFMSIYHPAGETRPGDGA